MDINASATFTAGTPYELKVRATDANQNIDIHYGVSPGEIKTLRFSGLGTISGYEPKIESTAFGNNIDVEFVDGVTSDNAVTLTAYKAEGPAVAVSVAQVGQTYLVRSLSTTVVAASANNIALVSGNNQSGAASHALANPFVVIVKDSYGNLVSGASVTFAISSTPGGGSLSTTSTTTNAEGLAQSTLTFGVSGAYQVTATSGSLTGSPVTSSATSLAPSELEKFSGNLQSKTINLPLDSALVVRLKDANDTGIPNELVTFAIIDYPPGAYPSGTNGKLSVTSVNTGSDGKASTVLTLGNKAGDYKVRATSGSLNADFIATALAEGAYKVVLTGPGSVDAGVVSPTAFTITLKDSYNNVVNASVATQFSLSTTATATGTFYSDNAGSPGNIIVDNTLTIPQGTSSAAFHYKDTVTGAPTITVTRTSGEPLHEGFTSANWNITVIPGGLARFVVGESTAAMTAGGSRPITGRATAAARPAWATCSSARRPWRPSSRAWTRPATSGASSPRWCI